MANMRLFNLLLVTQAVSLLGSTLSMFGLGVWAYEAADSVSAFTLIAVASTLPGIVLGPIIGVWIDRFERRRVLLGAQLMCAIVTLCVACLLALDQLRVWHIIALVPFASIGGAVLQTGFTASVVALVPGERLSQANGAVTLIFGLVQLFGPLLAGLLMEAIGITGVLWLDLASFLVALVTLILIRLPMITHAQEGVMATHWWQDIREAFMFLKGMPGVLEGLYVFSLIWFSVSAVQVLVLPLILSFGNAADLGAVQSAAGLGALIGGSIMLSWRGPQRRMYGILLGALLVACFLVVLPLVQRVWWIALCALLMMVCSPLVTVCSQTLWQQKVPLRLQGRAFALRNTMMRAAQPAAYVLAGLLADYWFEPAMLEDGWLAAWLGAVWGTGEGRGVAVLISLFGLMSLVLVLFAWSNAAIREVDSRIPDAETVN